jgi:hypothetical protein
MAMIKSRKHAQTRFNQHMSAALAAMLLPVAAHAAEAAPEAADQAKPQTLQEVKSAAAARTTSRPSVLLPPSTPKSWSTPPRP